MSSFIRNSKFRHVYVEGAKNEDMYRNFRLSTATGEQQYIKGNCKYFAVALQGGGGPIAVVDYEQKGAYPTGAPVLAGHKGAVLDFDFNPFHDDVLASCSDDSTIKVWAFPGGLTETITEPVVDLHGHGRKVTLLKFHGTADNVLASASADQLVKVWDIEKQSEVANVGAHGGLIQDLQWDATGARLGTTCKDKKVRLLDPRSGAGAEIDKPHEGSKAVKLAFLGDTGLVATVGFTRQSQRQLKIWDERDTSKELHCIGIDQAAGVLLPFFDPDTKMLYLTGKGDGNVRYYEINRSAKTPVFALSEYKSNKAGKGYCFVPKRKLDVMRCETARCLKLTSDNGVGVVEPLSFIVPRKSDAFQDDIFPDTYAGVPSATADEYLAGADNPPKTTPLNPDARGPANGHAKKAFVAMKTAPQLTAELDEARKRIADLEAKLAAAGIAY